jgi:hypothetical protein
MSYVEVNNYFSDKFYDHLEYISVHVGYNCIITSCIN